MKKEEKILYTFCAYLHNGYGPTKFNRLFNPKDEKDRVENPFKYLKTEFESELPIAKEFITKLKDNGIGYLCAWEDNYPPRLKMLANPPVILFFKGDISLLKRDVLAIIGTRKCSDKGIRYAKDFTSALVGPYVIASGLAFGIDSIANRISSEIFGKSIVVVPGSLINPHPYTNKFIFNKILENGGLAISEFPFTENIDKGSFVIRNRILAGISASILLVESPITGGSLITCRIARGINSQVFAIPANIELETFEGNNHLIKINTAQLVTSPKDILKDDRKLVFSNKPYNLSFEEELVLEVLKIYSDFDSICLALNGKISFDRIYDIMLNFEMDGIITRSVTGKYLIN